MVETARNINQTEQSEQSEQQKNREKTMKDIKEIIQSSNNSKEINKTLSEAWNKFIESNLERKDKLKSIESEANYLTLSNTNEIKVHLFWVDPTQVYLAVNDEKYTDSERTKQVIKALKEPGITIYGSWSKSIQDLQILMWKTLGIRLNPDWKLWKDTFSAMKRYLSGETATANPNNTNETSDISNNSSEVMFGDERLRIQKENDKNFVEIDWNRYYEYSKGMNWLWYRNGINNDGQKWTYIWDYVNGNEEWNWTITRDNEEKYQWNWENGEREWKGTYTRASGAKYEWEFKNGEREWKGTYTRANGNKYKWNWKNNEKEWNWTYTDFDWNKYEWEWKEGHAEWEWIRTWANWKSVEWIFAKEDNIMFGLKTPTKFIDDSVEYNVVRDNGLLKVVSEWKYEGKYISLKTWKFVDTPSTNHDSDQDNDKADNPKDNNVDNHASKQREQFQKYKKLNEEIQKLRNGESYEYKINDDIIFTFTKEKCILNDSGKEITFNNRSKKWFSYRIEPNKYITIKPNFIDIYDISKGMNKLYYQDGSWRKKFEWYTDNYWNPKEWIMTYNNGSKFEWNFIVWDTLKEWERHNVSFKEDDFWD